MTLEISYHFERQDEDEIPTDHFEDQTAATWVFEQIEAGNEWAWFCAKVWAEVDGVEGDPVYLGCCSYESEASWKADQCFADMKSEALDNLCEALRDAIATADKARTLLAAISSEPEDQKLVG